MRKSYMKSKDTTRGDFMANEVFIARQDTLESVKGTVENIDANVGTPNPSGGGLTY